MGTGRDCKIVDAGVRKPLDLKIQVPVEDMREPDSGEGEALQEIRDSAATSRSIWPAIYPELLALVKQHRSTIIFVNSRRGAAFGRTVKELRATGSRSPLWTGITARWTAGALVWRTAK